MAQFTLRQIFISIAISALAVSLWLIVFGPVVPKSSLERISNGTSQGVVMELLGPPSFIENENDWIYTRIGSPGWIMISFDELGRVIALDDESF